ncbi:hypothetical protein BDA99DRAFT_561790 [Phascolomyces articulosus]|uniref:Uncharacterized protein n=1 Tax=Phascolomyces articulosus TaxID=60185 RepID=A0AAD5PBT5_9FUNG|nr:hypothetical protein BDA99DRAFT_561790 [Phascolomyces articulosus]
MNSLSTEEQRYKAMTDATLSIKKTALMESGKPISNDNDTKDLESREKKSLNNTEFKAASLVVVQKLLRLSTPRLDSRIVSALLLEGMMDVFMSHITRLEEEQIPIDLQTVSLETKVKFAGHHRDLDDMEALKLSAHATELLCGTSANHLQLLNERFDIIALRLMDTLLPNSIGHLCHFGRVFQQLTRRNMNHMLDFIILGNNASRLFDYMLPYLNQGPVADALLSLLFFRDTDKETQQKRIKCYKRLCELGFLEWFLDVIERPDCPGFSDDTKEFLLRIIEEASQLEDTCELFKSLESDKGPEIIKSLVTSISDQGATRGRQLMVQILRGLVTSGTPPVRQSAMSQPAQGPLYSLCHHTRVLLSEHIPTLCKIIIRDHDYAPKKIFSFTIMHVELLETIYHALSDAPNKEKVLDALPAGFWKLFADLFFEKSSSSIFLTVYYKIFVLLVNINYQPAISSLLEKQNFITRIIDLYENKVQLTDARGHILLILNHLRLTSDTKKDGIIYQVLSSHQRYEQFLPTLRADTQAQTDANYTWKLDTCPRPAPHLGPIPPLRPSVMFSAYNSATLPLMGVIIDQVDEVGGIDLGSDFAYCLGFDDTGDQHTEMANSSTYQSRRNSLHSESGDSYYSSESDSRPTSPTNTFDDHLFPADLVFESLTPEEPDEPPVMDAKKKKKKKKRTSFTEAV